MALFRCQQVWKKVVLDTPIVVNDTTTEKTYTFNRYVRNITFQYDIRGSADSGTLSGNLQLGVGGTWNFVVGEVYGQQSIQRSGTHAITDNTKHKTISVGAYVDDTGGTAQCSIKDSIIKVLSYEELR